jgi:hypothetical protein
MMGAIRAPKRQGRGMRTPIPDDWAGEDWFCVQVQWPASAMWISVLVGFLTSVTNGRFWNEDTGSVLDAIAVGWQIYAKNIAFTPCDAGDGQICPDTPAVPCGGSPIDLEAILEEMEEYLEMPGIIDIKCENGKLWKRLSPCCEWVEVCDLGGITQDFEDPDGTFPPDPEGAAYKCRKARALADTFIDIMDDVMDAADDAFPQPFSIINEWTAISFNVPILWDCIFSMGPMDNDLWAAQKDYYADVLACKWADILTDDAGSVGEYQFDYLQAVAQTNLPTPLSTGMVELLQSVGRGDVSAIAISGLGNSAAVCVCPSQDTDPTSSWNLDWSQYVDFRVTNPATIGGMSFLAGGSEWTVGEGIQEDTTDGTPNNEVGIEWTITGTESTIERVWFEYWVKPATDYTDGPKAYTDDETLVAGSSKPDGDPSAGGIYTMEAAGLGVPTLNRQYARWEAKGNVPDPQGLTDSWTLRRIAIGGTGVNPMQQ